MNDRILLVVGDKFASYVAHKEAVTVSELLGLLSLPKSFDCSSDRKVLVPGQGIGDENRQALLRTAANSANLHQYDFSLWHKLPDRAAAVHAHKAHSRNVLVSVPRQISSDEFELDLMIDEGCELMTDHMSGQNMQGMVLMEAARQAMIVVTESHLVPGKGVEYSYVSDSLTVSYSNYAFPVSALIRTTIDECDITNPSTLRFLATTTVEQCGQPVASFTMGYTAIEKSRSFKQERIQSVRAHRQFLAGIASEMGRPQALVGREIR